MQYEKLTDWDLWSSNLLDKSNNIAMTSTIYDSTSFWLMYLIYLGIIISIRKIDFDDNDFCVPLTVITKPKGLYRNRSTMYSVNLSHSGGG